MANFAETFFGGVFIEMFIASILYGITTLQTFIYFQNYQSDRRVLKAIVAFVWILETAHTWTCIQFVYDYVIKNFGNNDNFFHIDWTLGVSVITEVLISSTVQAFYVRRVWIMSNNNVFVGGVLALVAVCRLAFGIGTCILTYQFHSWTELRAHLPILVTLGGGLGAAAFVDVMAALALSYYLMKGRDTRPKSSQGTVNLIMLYAVNTGAITSAASLIGFILFVTIPTSLIFAGLLEIQAKLYANCFLGSLNARAHIRKQSESTQYGTSFHCNSNADALTTVGSTMPRLQVFRSTIVTSDMNKRDTITDPERESDNSYPMDNIKGGGLV